VIYYPSDESVETSGLNPVPQMSKADQKNAITEKKKRSPKKKQAEVPKDERDEEQLAGAEIKMEVFLEDDTALDYKDFSYGNDTGSFDGDTMALETEQAGINESSVPIAENAGEERDVKQEKLL